MGNAFSRQPLAPLIKVQSPYSYALVPAHTLYPDGGNRYNNRHGGDRTYYTPPDRYYTPTPPRSPRVAPIYTLAPGTPARRHTARPPRRMASPRAERVPDFCEPGRDCRELGRDHRSYPPPPRPATPSPRGVAHHAPVERPAEQFPGDSFLDACFCTRECRCRKGNRVLFRTRYGDGRTEDGEHRYVLKEEEGRNCDESGVCGDDDRRGGSKGWKDKGKRGSGRRGSGDGDDSDDDGDDGCRKAAIGVHKLDKKLNKGLRRVDDRLDHITDGLGHISGGLDQLSQATQRGGNGRGRQYQGRRLGGAFDDNESYGDDDFGGIRPPNRRDPRGARVFGRGPGYSLQRPGMVRNDSNFFDSFEMPAYGACGGMKRTRGNGAQSRDGSSGRGGRGGGRHIPGGRISRNPMPGGAYEDDPQFTMHGGRNSMPHDLDGGLNDADPEPNDNWTDMDVGSIHAESPQRRRASPPGRPRRPKPSRHQSTHGRAQRRDVPPRNAYVEDASESI